MSRKKELSDLLYHAVNLLIPFCGYSDSRISELIHPFVGGVTLDALRNRIWRIRQQLRTVNNYSVSIVAGTYAVHGTKITYGDGVVDSLVVVVELQTGWVYAKALPRIDLKDVISAIYQIFTETEVDEAKLTKNQIVLLSYRRGKKELAVKKGVLRKKVATVIRKPVDLLVSIIRDNLKDWHKNIEFKIAMIDPPQVYEPVHIQGEWRDRKLLNEQIQEVLKIYNCQKRIEFPRTKDPACPSDRLYNELKKKQIKSKKKPPSRPNYL